MSLLKLIEVAPTVVFAAKLDRIWKMVYFLVLVQGLHGMNFGVAVPNTVEIR
jgi:hypothetical protein